MTGGERQPIEDDVPEAQVRSREGLSIVWVVPLVALVIAGWLAYQTLSQAGPEVTIAFEAAPGLEAGKSKIMYKGVEIGTVTTIKLDSDLGQVIVTADLVKEVETHLKAGAKFWIVEPKISVTGISDLGTLVSGNFIGFEPGSGADTRSFQALLEPPIQYDPKTGQRYLIETDRIGSLTVGAPINYLGVPVGSVLRYRLNEDGKAVLIDIFIEKPHDQLVREDSRFWDAGGISFSLSDLINASVRVGSIESLIAGGIAFDTPASGGGAAAPAGTKFKLLKQPPSVETEPAPAKGSLSVVLRAARLGSISVGDPILYREFQVGKVRHVSLSDDATSVDLTILIDPAYVDLIKSNTVFWNASGINAHFGLFSGATIDVESLGALISGGVAFATPDTGGQAVTSGTVFGLYDQPKDEWKDWAPDINLPKVNDQSGVSGSADSPTSTGAADTAGAATSESGAAAAPTTAPGTAAGPPMPNAVLLPAGRNQATPNMVRSHLEDLGFEDISELEKEGAIFHLRARWQGRPVKLKLDSNTGAIQEIN